MSLHHELESAITDALTRALQELEGRSAATMESRIVWHRSGTSQWSGGLEAVPALDVRAVLQIDWKQRSADIDALIEQHYPENRGLVGTRIFGQSGWGTDQRLMQAVQHLWNQKNSFQVSKQAIKAVAENWVAFLAADTVTFALFVPLLNASLPQDLERIPFTEGLDIVRLTEEQVSRVYGGHPLGGMFHGMSMEIIDVGLAGRITVPVARGELQPAEDEPHVLRDLLNQAMLALRTFRPQPIGYGTVFVEAEPFTPYLFSMGTHFAEGYVPFGSYQFDPGDRLMLSAHAALIMGDLDPALESACARLSDASVRLNPRDAILDAVIGMEAILLADTGERYRGELLYRFAMNYAGLSNTEGDHLAAFKLARELYDLRSDIAHGARLPSRRNLGGRNLVPNELASEARKCLRDLIVRFLPEGTSPSFRSEDFWLKRHLERP